MNKLFNLVLVIVCFWIKDIVNKFNIFRFDFRILDVSINEFIIICWYNKFWCCWNLLLNDNVWVKK